MVQLRVSLVLFLLCLTGRARADVEPIRIEYRADAGCPSESEFRRQVFSRTASARLANAGEPGRTFAIELHQGARGATGSLVIREQDGATVARRVNGKNCRDIAMVLALASALAIDPRAELAPREELADDDESDNGQGQEESSGSSAESTPPATPTTELVPSRDPASGARTRTVSLYDDTNSYTPRQLRNRVTVGPSVAFAFAPEPALGANLSYAFATSRSRHSAWFGVGLSWHEALPSRVSGATADFRFLTLRPELCPVSWPLSDAVELCPCAAARVGLVTAAGSDIAVAETETRFWADAELSFRFDASISGPWFARIELGAVLPFSRYRFVFNDPEQSVYPVPAVAGAGGFGVGVQF